MCLGIPGQVVEISDREKKLGIVDISGVKRQVNLACVAQGEDLSPLLGQWVLVHVGFAMNVIDPEEAARTIELLRELGEAQAELESMQKSGARP
ncbi:MAG: HypC/HybG/HupF family hydrogenase formation chaperone [Deltaproteobacteria bacterium]|jgi:hydrogenase expression/formation protein HypC|nr:HypC/HybG/HupF family hydrogenase formation chaperone [Deltaproteobacteria bacterium]